MCMYHELRAISLMEYYNVTMDGWYVCWWCFCRD